MGQDRGYCPSWSRAGEGPSCSSCLEPRNFLGGSILVAFLTAKLPSREQKQQPCYDPHLLFSPILFSCSVSERGGKEREIETEVQREGEGTCAQVRKYGSTGKRVREHRYTSVGAPFDWFLATSPSFPLRAGGLQALESVQCLLLPVNAPALACYPRLRKGSPVPPFASLCNFSPLQLELLS